MHTRDPPRGACASHFSLVHASPRSLVFWKDGELQARWPPGEDFLGNGAWGSLERGGCPGKLSSVMRVGPACPQASRPRPKPLSLH